MKLKDLTLVGGTVYLNIVRAAETETMTLSAAAAVKRYGDMEVLEHRPYEDSTDSEATVAVPDGSPSGKKGKRSKNETLKPGTDVVVLQG